MELLRRLTRLTVRIVIGVFALVVLIVYVLILMDDKPLEFVAGVLVVAGVLGGIAGLAYTHATTLSEALRGGINREARNLLQAKVFLLLVTPLGGALGLMQRYGMPDILLYPLGLGCVTGIALLLALALLLAGSALEYLSDVLAHNTTPEAVEAKYRQQRGWVAAFLGRSTIPVPKSLP